MLDPEIIAMTHTLTEKQRDYMMARYSAKEKQVSTAYICWVFSVYYFYLGKPVRNIFLWLAECIFIGWIWWVFCVFRMKGLVAEANREIATDLIEEARLVVRE